eukprot:TRINITY_DN23273_c0_g1_i1.p1 TRINITY_DN23273_c0_g1~~TRINITY_DN23273_c0_g1_i1.p1  ORF type:complete len:117 (+),score=2.31 TRINITY_DN23273_c0_g1_i1:41-352(+)
MNATVESARARDRQFRPCGLPQWQYQECGKWCNFGTGLCEMFQARDPGTYSLGVERFRMDFAQLRQVNVKTRMHFPVRILGNNENISVPFAGRIDAARRAQLA